jgi:hypothetical protein
MSRREAARYMNRDDLTELATRSDFISGIYNYCDRWCERCAFSARCFLYATETADADFDNPDVRDLNNAKFWRKLESIFKDANELIKQCAAEAGVDLDAIDQSEAVASHDQKTEAARRNEYSVLARNYARMVETWFEKELVAAEQLDDHALVQAKSDGIEIDAHASFEVIRWYQFFIATKVFRALLGNDDELRDVYPNDDQDEVNPAQTDANGSAKIALIAIDRSVNAWRVIESCIPAKQNSIAPLVALLENVRRGIEAELPLARDFIRPGFDEEVSEYAS